VYKKKTIANAERGESEKRRYRKRGWKMEKRAPVRFVAG